MWASRCFSTVCAAAGSRLWRTRRATRDRLYAEAEWRRKFHVIDTGGIEPFGGSEMLKFMRLQAEIAFAHADVVIFVTDIVRVTASDAEVASILIAVGQADCAGGKQGGQDSTPPPEIYEFYNLAWATLSGFGAARQRHRRFVDKVLNISRPKAMKFPIKTAYRSP